MGSSRPLGGRQAAWMLSLSCTGSFSLIRAMSLLRGEAPWRGKGRNQPNPTASPARGRSPLPPCCHHPLLHDEVGVPVLVHDEVLHLRHHGAVVLHSQVVLAQHHAVRQARAAGGTERGSAAAAAPWDPPQGLSSLPRRPPVAVGGRQHPAGRDEGPTARVAPVPVAAVLQRDLGGHSMVVGGVLVTPSPCHQPRDGFPVSQPLPPPAPYLPRPAVGYSILTAHHAAAQLGGHGRLPASVGCTTPGTGTLVTTGGH